MERAVRNYNRKELFWESLLEGKVWITKREPEGSCDRGADETTVEERVNCCAADHLSRM